jgi:hypothetical protein
MRWYAEGLDRRRFIGLYQGELAMKQDLAMQLNL